MYADRHHMQTSRFSPTGLTAAIAVNALFVAALIFSAPTMVPTIAPDRPLPIFQVPEQKPPPPEKPAEPLKRTAKPIEHIDAPTRPIEIPISRGVEVTAFPEQPSDQPIVGSDPGPAIIEPIAPTAPPALVKPSIDQRYARDFQPIYPAAERRAGREGRVTVSVLVGVDGRVKDARRVGATSDAFWQVTLDRALAKWRFKPGTRGGVPVEAWRELTLTFVLEG